MSWQITLWCTLQSCEICLEQIYLQGNSKLNQNPFIVRNGQDVFQVCKQKLEKEPCHETDHHGVTFHFVMQKELRCNFDLTVSTVEGTKSFHSVKNTGKSLQLLSRQVGCVCHGCVLGKPCENKELIDEWTSHTLWPSKSNKSLYKVLWAVRLSCELTWIGFGFDLVTLRLISFQLSLLIEIMLHLTGKQCISSMTKLYIITIDLFHMKLMLFCFLFSEAHYQEQHENWQYQGKWFDAFCLDGFF